MTDQPSNARGALKRLADALIPRRYLNVRAAADPRGSSCVMPPHELSDFIDGNDPEEYVVRPVWMTRRQFKQLGDFDGF